CDDTRGELHATVQVIQASVKHMPHRGVADAAQHEASEHLWEEEAPSTVRLFEAWARLAAASRRFILNVPEKNLLITKGYGCTLGLSRHFLEHNSFIISSNAFIDKS
ncbi:MAG: hypothetical protein ACXV2F_06420, partial [Halobacteriota archaeon]